MLQSILLIGFIFISSVQSNAIFPQNVITVPPNCPEGQEFVNGECRDIWKSGSVTPAPPLQKYDNRNMITVPPNCPPGQSLVNGVCRDIWRGGSLAESKLFEKILEEIWTKLAYNQNPRQTEENEPEDIFEDDFSWKNIISIPNQCPKGYRPDALGICRKIF
ncbi:unnamed protein product [Euphydryas editha]|uniref:Uncharacterized protein n=1 Tax=Euphydryas editha TaxID=104508 RepID=A0AAU9TJV9_EUPED|nr:unnamed protein product [Euphydryas editha]